MAVQPLLAFKQCSGAENCRVCNNKTKRPPRRPRFLKSSSLSTDSLNPEQKQSVNDVSPEVTPIPLADDGNFESSEADVIIDDEGFEADGFYVEHHGKIYQYDPRIISDEDFKSLLSKQENERSFQSLMDELADFGTLLYGWNTTVRTETIYLTQLSFGDKFPVISKSVTINPDLSVIIYVHNQQLLPDHPIFNKCSVRSKQDVLGMLSELAKFNVCCGNFDDDFLDFVPGGVGPSQSGPKAISASFREGNFHATSAVGVKYESTIRSVDCQLLVNGIRCHACSQYRGTLRRMRSRRTKSAVTERIGPQSRVPYTALSKDELCQKLRNTQMELKQLQVTNERIKQQLRERINEEGVEFNNLSVV